MTLLQQFKSKSTHSKQMVFRVDDSAELDDLTAHLDEDGGWFWRVVKFSNQIHIQISQ